MRSFEIILAIGFAYSLLASLAAYVIAYNEYAHHFVVKRQAIKHAIEVALVAFVFFAVVTFALAFLLSEKL
jgi:Na+-transporting NADH:ubiquinone oxidoreductase subunit NqrE